MGLLSDIVAVLLDYASDTANCQPKTISACQPCTRLCLPRPASLHANPRRPAPRHAACAGCAVCRWQAAAAWRLAADSTAIVLVLLLSPYEPNKIDFQRNAAPMLLAQSAGHRPPIRARHAHAAGLRRGASLGVAAVSLAASFTHWHQHWHFGGMARRAGSHGGANVQRWRW